MKASDDLLAPAAAAAGYGDAVTPIGAPHRRAETHPDRTALIAGGQAWTMREAVGEADARPLSASPPAGSHDGGDPVA